jgi:hypothetical protein
VKITFFARIVKITSGCMFAKVVSFWILVYHPVIYIF